MPEVCEVLITAIYLAMVLKGYRLESIKINSGKYKRELPEGFANFSKRLPLKLIDVSSKGKFMWMEFEDNNFMMNGFGLVGEWGFEKKEYSHIELVFTKGTSKKTLYFSDARNFGNITFGDRNQLEEKKRKLAPDLLQTPFTDKMFEEWFDNYNKTDARGNQMIVKVLMDQGAIGSGIGNYLVAESLYEAKISPKRQLNSFTVEDKHYLAKAIRKVTKQCFYTSYAGYLDNIRGMVEYVRNGESVRSGEPELFHPTTTIDPTEFKFKVYQKKKDLLGNPIIGDKIITGRTTYWCPTVQK